MKKTIYIVNGLIYTKTGFLKKKLIDSLNPHIKEYFNMNSDGKYSIKIVRGDTYRFKKELNDSTKRLSETSIIRRFLLDSSNYNYYIYNKENKKIGYVCIDKFEKLFFRPDPNKRYNIIVKKIK